MGLHLLRLIAGAMCLEAVLVAALTARRRIPADRTRFISEILALCRHQPRGAPGFWGSALASTLLALGALTFMVDAVQQGGAQRALSLATGLTLLAVVALPLHLVEPEQGRGFDFAHPIAAASFYLAALLLGAVGLFSTGPIGFALSIVHVGTSCVLIGSSIYASCREFPPCRLWPPFPPIGTRILLDRRAASRASRVRWFQWPATLAVGVALSAGALGI